MSSHSQVCFRSHCIDIAVYDSTSLPLGANFDLSSKDSRRTWENQFSTSYILPILKEMAAKLKNVQELVIDDSRQGIDSV